MYLLVELGYYYLNMTMQRRSSSSHPGSGVHTVRILQTTFSVAILLATLFVAFLGAIIAVQVIPGLMLFGMMLKGLASLFRKEVATKEVD